MHYVIYLEREDLWTSIPLPPTSPSLKHYLHVKNDYFQISPYSSNYIRWSPYIAYYLAAVVGFCGHCWGVGWIVVVLGFSQTAISVPQFPEAQQASRSIRGNGAVLTSATLLLRPLSHIQRSKGGLEMGEGMKRRTMSLQCHCWPAFSLVLMSVFALFFLG